MLWRLSRMSEGGSYTAEFESMEQYIRLVQEIPWGKYSVDNLDLDKVRADMERNHYGLVPVKNTILEYLAVVKLQKQGGGGPAVQPGENVSMAKLQGSSTHAPVLCFVGIQGVGKTSMAKSIASSLGRSFVRISLGAMGNASQLRGKLRGEENAEPGQIIKALTRCGTMNPLILLDEIDKTSTATGLRADLMAALLEILDPEQNATFIDHYVDYPVDLSQVMFITTSNNLGGISAALIDRLEIIRFGSYSDEDKMNIAKNYMLPKVRQATGLTEQQLSFADDVWPLVVRPLGFDAGVRELERTLTKLARKVAMMIVEGQGTGFRITTENFRQFIPEDIGVYS
jgi:ATP-dependent Lon protease